MISKHDYLDMQNWLDECRRPLLVSHRRVDGDAVGALAAVSLALQAAGRQPRVALFDPFPERYAFLQDLIEWHQWDAERAVLTADCDALVILDTCAVSQLEPIAEYLPQAPRTLVMDHHPTRDPIATRPGDLRLLDDSAGAVSLLVAEWLQAADIPLTPAIATALYTGMATDCGWFRFSNCDARLLRAAADMAEAGAVGVELYRSIHSQEPVGKLRLMGRMLTTLELHADDRLAVMTLRPADFAAAGADRTMTDELVNEAGRIGCVDGIILFTEQDDGSVRVNFRSKRILDVAKLAAQFGGGGHVRAAGARPSGAWDEVVPKIVAAAVDALGPV